ncbi:MAG: hypothetical protein WBM44_24030 [Waterburya sp.]
MSETPVQVTITLSDPQLRDEELQEAVQNLQLELREVEGITEADLIPVEQAPPDSKGIGGFLLGKLQALVSLKHLKTLVSFVGHNLFGRTVEIKAEGNGRKLEVKLSRPEDIDKVMPQVERFING